MDLYRKVRLACAEGMSQREAVQAGTAQPASPAGETVPNFVPDAFSYVIGKRSSNMMASWLLTACHSRTERFHSVEVALSAR